MAFFGKEYKYDRESENFPAYVKSLNLPADMEKSYIESRPVIKLEKNGDSFTHTVTVGDKDYPVTFKSGVEFDDVWGDKVEVKGKTTYTLVGNHLNYVNLRNGKKNATTSEYTDKDLKLTFSGDGFDGFAYRYFKAV